MLLVVVQVHTAAQTETPHLAIGALPFAGPFAVAELVEAILPHVPETVPVNIPLMEIGPDGGTARNRPVHPDRGSRNPGGALVEIVPHLAFVTAQKAFAGVTQVDASLLTGTLYELQHLAELCVGNRERRIVLGPADREDREDAPIFHSFGDQQLLELFESSDHRRSDACNHVVGEPGLPHDQPDRVERLFETAGIAPDVVMSILKAVETDRNGSQPRIHQTSQAVGVERQTVGHHPPGIAPAGNLPAGFLQIAAHEHLSAGKDQQNIFRAVVGRNLLIEHLQEIRQRHIRHAGIDPTVAAAVTASQITT